MNPVFECHLDPDLMQNLITDPGSMMKPKGKFFWLRTLVHGIFTGGQFVFETFPPQDTKNPQLNIAARTLFQLDGDMLLKIDENILTRTDGIKILEAHSRWTNWCLDQLMSTFALKREFFLTFFLRYLLKLQSAIWSVWSVVLKFLVRWGMHGVKKKIKQIL
ncbi:MAG: hypothetical protein IBX41_04770 [Methanophagales archaeon]|nr:hypothetical protein [Methanophagales archaeon]